MIDAVRFPPIDVTMGCKMYHIGGSGVGQPVSREAFLALLGPWEAQQVWGPIVQSSSCPACRAHIEHRHGFYAPSGGGE